VIVIAAGRIAAQGTPDETLDPARIGEVFGVEIETARFGDQRVLFARRPI
jgi:ABC-type cobalamin/Fe3+-siderophores transport system ATPase subunit